jgi:tetratricopeptide (TPR) repeat protein
MGGKPTGTGKHVYFCAACLIFLSFLGCTLAKDIQDREIARRYLLRSQELFAQGDYEGSLRENQRVLSLGINGPPEDEALFNMGLLYAHFGNPKKDYQKSLVSFRKIVKDHPRSPWVEQAKIWVGVLEAMEKLNEVIKKSKQVDIEIEEKKRDQQR